MKHDPWHDLRKLTHARIALGRAGHSVPTRELLDFRLAHSRARDAVWLDVDFAQLKDSLKLPAEQVIEVHSQCVDKQNFLLNPDLGRKLAPDSLAALAGSKKISAKSSAAMDCVLVIGDGLSAAAVHANAARFASAFLKHLANKGIHAGPVVLARHARVALGDEIGETLGARSVVILIGERPGLASAQSLGVYATWSPSVQKTDADRNCISNIHDNGLPPEAAAEMTAFLVHTSIQRQLSGVGLKIEYPALINRK